MIGRTYPTTLDQYPISTTPIPTRQEMDAVFQLCRSDHWESVFQCLRMNPLIAKTNMIMGNHISTTVLHQAITSEGDIEQRARVMYLILHQTPEAARMKNGYGSLPLHVITQRNTTMGAKVKEALIRKFIDKYEGALCVEGGVGRRTPLHIIFTDYKSPELTRMMVEKGREAIFMKDKNGYLPAHVACSRHCSPRKLQMLLKANPASLYEQTNDGHTLLSLAIGTATDSHPNHTLIDSLKKALGHQTDLLQEAELLAAKLRAMTQDLDSPIRKNASGGRKRRRKAHCRAVRGRTRDIFTANTAASVRTTHDVAEKSSKTHNVKVDEDTPAGLLLHFSRNGTPQKKAQVMQTVAV